MSEITQYSLKYRPRYFEEIYGQDVVVKALQKRVKENDFPQAICLRGPVGTGKTSLSFILAAAMMDHDENGNPNWNSPDGKSVLNGTFDRDVLLLDASRWSSKDAMIEFTQSIQSKPLFSKSGIRVCIIEESDQASNAAMLSLLKILESPKPWNKFILCSMEDKGVPKSILSRCQVYNIKQLGIKDIMYGLKHVMEQSGTWEDSNIPVTFRTEGLATIAGCSEGSMRNAVQYLEKCIINEIYDKEGINELLGIIDEAATWEILDSLLAKEKNETVLKKLIWTKNGDEAMKIYNYMVVMLSEAMLYKETGISADDGNVWRMKKMSSNSNLDSLFYCLTLHPQMNKPYIKTSDLLSSLACYYQGLNFKPNTGIQIPQQTRENPPEEFSGVKDVDKSSLIDSTRIRLRESKDDMKEEKIVLDENPVSEKKIIIGTPNTPPINVDKNGMRVRVPKPDISTLNIAF